MSCSVLNQSGINYYTWPVEIAQSITSVHQHKNTVQALSCLGPSFLQAYHSSDLVTLHICLLILSSHLTALLFTFLRQSYTFTVLRRISSPSSSILNVQTDTLVNKYSWQVIQNAHLFGCIGKYVCNKYMYICMYVFMYRCT